MRWRALIALAALATFTAGCATKKYVGAEVTAAEARSAEMVEAVSGRVEENQQRLTEHDERLESISATAQDALDRAVAAGKLAQGRFLYEVVLNAQTDVSERQKQKMNRAYRQKLGLEDKPEPDDNKSAKDG